LKPEQWGSPLVQEKYQEEKACDKRHPYRIIIITIIIIIIIINHTQCITEVVYIPVDQLSCFLMVKKSNILFHDGFEQLLPQLVCYLLTYA